MNRHGMAGSDGSAGPLSSAMRRTMTFMAAGAALLVAGWAVQPRFRTARIEPESERVLFPDLSDAAKAASLSVVSYDDELATLRPFKVVQSGGVWVLPSHENYPADAKDHLAAAATALVDLPILGVVSTSPGDHETYGVIEPDPERIKPGMTGVGRLVEIRDAAGNRLARLIIGKEDKQPAGADRGGRPLRFVRKAGQDPVYRVALDTSKFTTRFDDWIEKDLLKISPWDIRRVTIDDSSCSFGVDEASGRLRVSQDRRALIELGYDDREAAWTLEGLQGFVDGKPRPEELANDEELATGKLNELRTALGDLKIVDVARKPTGLSGELRAEASFTEDREAVASLAQRGFFPFASGEILSSNGETIVGMRDGVEYLLRFGNGTAVAADEAEESGEAARSQIQPIDAGSDGTTGRYLFVMARFNEDLLDRPILEALPEVPGVPADASKNAAAPDAEGEGEEGEGEQGDGEQGDGEGEAGVSDGATVERGGDPGAADEAEAKTQAALEERRRIERENRRKQEEYDGKVEAGRKRVRDLNNRFADWYYVVSDAEYARIHLDRSGIVQRKSPPPEDAAVD